MALDDLAGFSPIDSLITDSFAPSLYVDTGGDEGDTTIDVKGGKWGSMVFADVTNIGDETTPYIVADRGTGTILAQASAPTDYDFTKRLLVTLTYETYTTGSDEYPDNPPYEGEKVIKSWHRHQFGDIKDFLVDGDGYTAPSGRQTIERNPEVGSHNIESQIANVDSVKLNTKSVPYFTSEAAKDPEDHIRGIINWAAIDTYLLPILQKTIDIVDHGVNGKALELYYFGGASDNQVPYKKDMGGGEKDLAWEWVVTYGAGAPGAATPSVCTGLAGGGTGSCAITITPTYSTFSVGAGKLDIGVPAVGSPINCYGSVDWSTMDCSDVNACIDWSAMDCTNVNACIDWSAMDCSDVLACLTGDCTWLTGMLGSCNWTHPHEKHTFNADDHDGTAGPHSLPYIPTGSAGYRYLEVASTATRNNMSGVIGTGAGVNSIAPDTRQLYDATVIVLDWGTHYLKGAGITWYADTTTLFRSINTTDAANENDASASISTTGGLAIAKTMCADTVKALAGTDFTIDVLSGDLQVSGGASITKKFQILDTTNSSWAAGNGTGSFRTKGGAYIEKQLFVLSNAIQPGRIYVGGNTDSWSEIGYSSVYFGPSVGDVTLTPMGIAGKINLIPMTGNIWYGTPGTNERGQNVPFWFRSGGFVAPDATEVSGYILGATGGRLGPYKFLVRPG